MLGKHDIAAAPPGEWDPGVYSLSDGENLSHGPPTPLAWAWRGNCALPDTAPNFYARLSVMGASETDVDVAAEFAGDLAAGTWRNGAEPRHDYSADCALL